MSDRFCDNAPAANARKAPAKQAIPQSNIFFWKIVMGWVYAFCERNWQAARREKANSTKLCDLGRARNPSSWGFTMKLISFFKVEPRMCAK
jgi:hypothetical protein